MDAMESLERIFRIVGIMLGGAFLMRVFEHHWPVPAGWPVLFLVGSLGVYAEAAYRRIVGLLERQNSLLLQIAAALGREPCTPRTGEFAF